MPETLFSTHDCAKLLGIEEHRITYAQRTRALPEPTFFVAGKRIYTAADLADIAKFFGLKPPKLGGEGKANRRTSERANIPAHLELVELIQNELPELVEKLGGGSTFYQFRQIDPTGIQIWVTLNWKMSVLGLPKRAGRRAEPGLHEQIRQFLVGLEQKSPGLNERLKDAGLATLDRIEILPTQSSQVSVPGCYGKTLFTTKELKLVEGKVDVLALDRHIREGAIGGNVLPRYKALVEACWGNDFRSCGAEVSLTESSAILALPPSSAISTSGGWPESADLIIPLEVSSKEGGRYWTDLTRKALHGVTSPDSLYEEYLQPLAQCLFFRDFVHCPDREELVEEELFAWVTAKHNGNVSRILAGEERAVRSQCRQVAKKVEATTCKAVRSYYQSILANDLIYPHYISQESTVRRACWATLRDELPRCHEVCQTVDIGDDLIKRNLRQRVCHSGRPVCVIRVAT